MKTCKNPTDVKISPLGCVTITLPAICCNTSATCISVSPEFLSKGIKRHAGNAPEDDDRFSAVHHFLITSTKVLYKSNCYLQI